MWKEKDSNLSKSSLSFVFTTRVCIYIYLLTLMTIVGITQKVQEPVGTSELTLFLE